MHGFSQRDDIRGRNMRVEQCRKLGIGDLFRARFEFSDVRKNGKCTRTKEKSEDG